MSDTDGTGSPQQRDYWAPVTPSNAPPPPQPTVGAMPPGSWQPAWSQPTPAMAPGPLPPPPVVNGRPMAVGLTLAGIGALLVLLSVTEVDWLNRGVFGSVSFGDLNTESGLYSGPGLFKAYFLWLGITLFVVMALLAFGVRLVRIESWLVRAGIAALGVTAAGLTFGAMWSANSFHDVVHYAGAGMWFAIVGFLLMGAAAVV